ncbi:acylneuraminate cytidylyltransferase family protein [Mesobacillus stamsii]|uniref:CMP-N,N'-diacetyllegionaminic acid synthase n=1 Tax=Mesobacillus stamsii TaxID=225347 RepID=A0ABU0G0D0_9BACI|nr:acylneuraminate cytidylyltransferase family protein [Mesobacillus stamsii]MDQ0415657.1 CMP-N,N'-diacetyllegionaminic acid synthase [Mesobacillus stamsii]
MYRDKSFIGIVPARAGSKGIPNKNIININGKPLIQYTIEEAKTSMYLDEILVSTDSHKIAEISKKCGANVPFLRPVELADDTAKTIDVIIHALEELNCLGKSYDYIVLLQPTQPLRKGWHIDDAIKKIIDDKHDDLVSVSEVSEHPILFRTIDQTGRLHNLLNVESTVRRQEFTKYYKVNGAIYINNIRKLSSNTSLNDNTLAYIMDKEYDLDIDEPNDIELLKINTK